MNMRDLINMIAAQQAEEDLYADYAEARVSSDIVWAPRTNVPPSPKGKRLLSEMQERSK